MVRAYDIPATRMMVTCACTALLVLAMAACAAGQTCPSATPLVNFTSVQTNTDFSVYRVTPTYARWSAVAVRAQDAANWNIEARDATAPYPTCYTGLLANSSTTQVDFLVTDWRYRPLGTDYLAVGTGTGVGTSARVEFENPGSDQIPNQPFGQYTTGATDVIGVNEMQMFTGIPYRIRVTPSAGLSLRVFVFAPVTSGTGWLARSDRQAELALVAGTENLMEYTPTVSGYHAIVIVNEDGASGTYLFTVGRCPFSASGLTDDLPLYIPALDDWPGFTPGSASWGVVGVRGELGYSYNLDVAPFPRSQVGPFSACTDSVLAAQYSGLGARLVLGDFRSLPWRFYTAHVGLEGAGRTSSAGYVEWEGGQDALIVNGPPLAMSPPPHNVFDAWSVQLGAGGNYDFHLTPEAGSTAIYQLLLFRNPTPGTGYWATRPDAVYVQGVGTGSFTPAATDLYGLVVVNDNGGTGGYSLDVTCPQAAVDPVAGRLLTSRIRTLAPNPVVRETRITYVLARAGRAVLEIRDVAGHRVGTVSLGDRPAGEGEFTWDGRTREGARLEAGVYFAVLKVEGRAADHAKLVMLR